MRETAQVMGVMLWFWATAVGQSQTDEQKPFALTQVTVIDVTGAPAKRDMTVVIATGRIAAIGKNEKIQIPKAARIIDATGKFLTQV